MLSVGRNGAWHTSHNGIVELSGVVIRGRSRRMQAFDAYVIAAGIPVDFVAGRGWFPGGNRWEGDLTEAMYVGNRWEGDLTEAMYATAREFVLVADHGRTVYCRDVMKVIATHIHRLVFS